MSGFSAEWLALRAPADDAARSAELLSAAAAFAGAGLIADIGGGTGATFRALGPLAPKARWRVLDADAALLAHLPDDARVSGEEVDLAATPEAIFAPRPRLVAASAFFDLVSRAWIERFADLLAESGAGLYAALTYDGREAWRPAPPSEATALAAFHADMRRDKGFGPALGPDAPAVLADALSRRGFALSEARSDWRLARPRDAALIEALAAGAGDALTAADGFDHAAWLARRRAAKTVEIGHGDLLALPA